MKLRKMALSMLLTLLAMLPNRWALAASPEDANLPQDWQAVAPGIDYQKFHINNPRPVDIFVTRMQRSNLSTTIESSIAQGRLSGGVETVSNMAQRYDQAINYWGSTWGNRNDVVVAINGYFFGGLEEPPGVPWSGVVHSGWYAKRFYETRGDAGFAWKSDRTAHIGSCVTHPGSANYVTFVRSNYTPNINDVNVVHDQEGTILYTPQYDASTLTAAGSDIPKAEILIEMTRPAMVLPTPAKAIGFVRDIRVNAGSTPLPFDHVVLASWGDDGLTMQDKIAAGLIAIGDEVHITQEIADCPSVPSHDWTKTYASLGGDYHFLTDGVVRTVFSNPDAAVRNSRTAIAFNADYIYFVVVDGFNLNVSEGINIPDLGNFLLTNPDILATDAVSMDSGTSSEMAINGEVVNNTYCNYTRDCGMRVPEGASPPPGGLTLPLDQTYGINWTDEVGVVEPLVGSGMLMVVVEPITRSLTYTPTQAITVTAAADIRLGPGTNYAVLSSVPAGSDGEIVAHANHMEGVLAKGSYWWKVAFGDVVGWVKEEQLSGGTPPPPPLDFSVFLPYTQRTDFATLSALYLSEPGLFEPALETAPVAPPTPNLDYPARK